MALSVCRKGTKSIISRVLFSTQAQTTPFPSFRAAKTAVLSESNPDKLAELFEQSAHFPKFRRHRPLFYQSVHKLVRSNRPDLIDRLLQSQQQYDSPPIKSEGFWIRLMKLYSDAGMVDHALQTLHRCSQKRYFALTEKSFNAILGVHLDNGMFGKVHQLFETMPQRLGVTPGVVSNNFVLKAFVKENKIDSAREWIRKMESDRNVLPSIDSYNIILEVYLKNGDMNAFDGVLKEVLNKKLEDNVTTYNYRILRLCKNKECARAKKLLDEMIARGLKPVQSSYNPIIDGFCGLGDFESAKKVLEGMLADGLASPNTATYYSMIRSMVKDGEFDLALEVCQEILKRNWVPPFEATEGLVHGLVKMSKAKDAKEIVDKMKKKLSGPAVHSWGKIEASLPLQVSAVLN